MECSKLGVKGTLECVLDIRSTLNCGLICAKVPTISKVILDIPSTPTKVQEELTLTA